MRKIIFKTLFLILSFYSFNSIAQSEKVTIKADRVFGDQKNNVVNAVGNVEISNSQQTVTTDAIKYNKNTGWINSKSQVELNDYKTGDLFAKRLKIKDDFSAGEFIEPILIFKDGSYIKSKKAHRKSVAITEFERPEFSICPNEEIIKNDRLAGKTIDLITLSSYKTTVDSQEDRFKSSHVIIKLLETPIFYFPYISLPGKKTPRKSGFLSPSYTNNSRLGLGIRTPYFINLNEYSNLIITPNIYLSNSQFLIQNNLKQQLEYGQHNTMLEIANNETTFTNDINTSNRTESDYRYKFSSEGNFSFDENNSVDFNVLTVGDKDFLKDYNFNFLPYTESELGYSYTNDRDYLTISSVRFQELENFNVRDQSQWVLPSTTYHVQSQPKYLNEIYSLTSNATAINRENGLQYRRLSSTPKVTVPISFLGNVLKLELANQIDYYNIEYNFDNTSPVNKVAESETNNTTFASAEWKIPLIKKKKNKTYIVEPKIKYDHISSAKNTTLLANEDSNNSELTINNLFFNDRIAGYDRSEEGQRLTYGANTTIYQNLSKFEFDIGQSYLIKENNNGNNVNGYNDSKKSNIVGKISYNYDKTFLLNYNYQLDENSLSNKVNFLTTNINYKKISFSNALLLIRKGVTQSNEKIFQNTSNFSYKFNSRYILSASLSKDLVAKKDLRRRISIRNDNCCVITEFSVSESNISNLATKERSINLNIILKEIGF